MAKKLKDEKKTNELKRKLLNFTNNCVKNYKPSNYAMES